MDPAFTRIMACCMKCHYDYKLLEEGKADPPKEELEKLILVELESAYKEFGFKTKDALKPNP